MFKKFMEKIANCEGREDAIQNIFYGPEGVDLAYQKGKLTYKEFEIISV